MALKTPDWGSMHYERAPRFGWSKLEVAPPPLRRIERNCGAVCGGKKCGSVGKSAGEWHFTSGKDKRWHE
jgi:hypothetical protein